MKTKNYHILVRLLSYIWTSDRSSYIRIIISCIFTIITIGLAVILPIVFSNIITILHKKQNYPHYLVMYILVGYCFLWILNNSIKHLREMIFQQSFAKALRLFTLNIFDHLHSLTLRFHVEQRTGALTSYLERAHTGFEAIFWGCISFLLPTIIELCVATTILLYFYGSKYGFALFIITTSYALFSYFFSNQATNTRRIYNEKRAHANAHMIDTLVHFETVKYFNNEHFEHIQVNKMLTDQEQAGVKNLFTESVIQIGQGIIIGFGLLYMTTVSGNAVYQETITVGDFVLINGYVLQFALPLQYFGYVMQQIRKGIQDVHSVFEILDTKPEIKNSYNFIHISAKTAEIAFENVCFGYTQERPILHNISFTIPQGKTVAFVGPTGAGKSTITRLLLGFYEINSGKITINGHDIFLLSPYLLRSIIGIVPQDAGLFNNTLYYNIAYGDPLASPQEVYTAAHLAQLDPLLHQLPEKYETVVGERGLKLSGGEKQRLAIARVLLKKPLLYIFDEATSALDNNTEQEIQKNIIKIASGSTAIIIAHRLSTIIHADQIIVLEQGAIVQQGTHAQLLTKSGLYADLWQRQL